MKIKGSRLGASLATSTLLASFLVGLGATDASADPFHCNAPRPTNNSSQVWKASKNLYLQRGPYSDCDDISYVPEGRQLYGWCYWNNSHGNHWWFVRMSGTEIKGWVYIDNLTAYDPGSTRECPIF